MTAAQPAAAPATGSGSLARLAQRLTLPVILLVAAALRFYHLSGQSLWSDEGNSVALARRGFAEIAQRTAFDIHPPLYYWLLKLWIGLLGDSEAGLRSLSAGLSIVLVYVIARLGGRLFSTRMGLLAAFIAALSPLQIYYAQEARMYTLLALLSSLTVWLALLFFDPVRPEVNWRTGLAYVLVVTAGLYTHYAYPLILVVVNAVVLLDWLIKPQIPNPKSKILNWLALQLLPLLLYLPWLPIAWRQVTTWPSERQPLPLLSIIAEVSQTLLFGLSWPFGGGLGTGGAVLLVLLAGLGMMALRSNERRQRPTLPLHLRLALVWVWLLLPVLLTLVIFSPAFLKFLLVASPPLCMLLALALDQLTSPIKRPASNRLRSTPYALRPYLLAALLLSLILIPSLLSLYSYYTDPTYARDNYRGIVNFVKAVGGPQDGIILNAEGQQDVFNYYYERPPRLAAPVYPLPRQRPLDEAATLAELQTLAENRERLYAVYWASQQADPGGVIEGWLDSHLFKATDQWYGNVRLVSYAGLGDDVETAWQPLDIQFGPHIRLTGYRLSALTLRPGEILRLGLAWETDAPLAADYVVFAQLLDSSDHLVGQRDAPPQLPTTAWPAAERIEDQHGLFVEPGTPPGSHRLIVGLYDRQNGQRLPLAGQAGDFVALTALDIIKPAQPLPPEAFTIQHRLDASLGAVTLLGYDFYKVGYRSEPETPLHSGDPVQVVLYWQDGSPRAALADELRIEVVSSDGASSPLSMVRPLAGVDYPPNRWSPGETVRAQHEFFLAGLEPALYRLAFSLIGAESGQTEVVYSRPFRVE
ncbi:MAG: glycosyltransferase family 39 protein [Anaerolineae bacterium]|nr:glycosyltransferase family 39 protein [Anaerolineae bacterium]